MMFAGGIVALVVGRICLRMMDDRPDVPIRADLMAALRRTPPETGRGTDAGRFIVLEGGEGAGKSTMARRLGEAIERRGHEVVLTFEPGATTIGQRLRQVLLDPANTQLGSRTEALLYAADRAQHVAEIVRPAMERGAVVISDRYVDSSIAYQAGGRGLPEHEVRRLSRWATSGLVPDLVIVLDLDPEEGLRRTTGPGDRLEAETLQFHQRVRQAFLDLARRGGSRYLVVDASAGPDEVYQQILDEVLSDLPDLPASRVSMTLPFAEVPR
jgi:dTMP kinase